MLEPIFIHSLWRTGSTYLFSKFRENDKYYCFYEPLYEGLASNTKERLQNLSDAESLEKLHHPKIDKALTFEFPLELVEDSKDVFRVPNFDISLAYDKYILVDIQSCEQLKLYIQSLIDFAVEKGKVPVFQFCRTTLRQEWFKKNFPESDNLYLRRSHRDQWESILSFSENSNYFLTVLFLILCKYRNLITFRPFIKLLGDHRIPNAPVYAGKHISEEFGFYEKLAYSFSLEEKYKIFYYFHKMADREGEKIGNTVTIDKLSDTNSEYNETYSATYDIDLKDCSVKKYDKYTLTDETMSKIEDEIEMLWK